MKSIIHVLTLAYRTDRRDSITQQSIEQNFDIKFFEGEKAEKRKDTRMCISKGHKSIIQYAKDNNLDSIIIAEDDLFFYGEGAFQYYLDNTPKSYDLYLGCLYQGELDSNNRVINGMSGSHTLYKIHSRFYNFALNEVPDDCHQDRFLGNVSHKFEYYVCPKIVAGQTAGYSDNLKKSHNGYEVYLENRKVYGRDKS